MSCVDIFSKAQAIIENKFFFLCLRRSDQAKRSSIAAANLCYSVDESLIYEPFFADFGPLNLGQTFRFCQRTQHLLQVAEKQGKRLFFLTCGSDQWKANAAVLVGAFQIIYLGRSSKEAYKPLKSFEPFPGFRDASSLPPTYLLTVQQCLKGVQKAKEVGFIDWHMESSEFDVEEYEKFETVDGGDLNWIVPKKLVAFAGPSAKRTVICGYKTHVPEDYVPYFKAKSVSAVVRLNNKVYESRRFTNAGLKHFELFFPDGSCPNLDIVWKFLEICGHEQALAVHCKAGLGRTGVLICAYMINKHYFTAEEAIGYIRICRPGSVIGPQQNFIKHIHDILCGPSPREREPVVPDSKKAGGPRTKHQVPRIPDRLQRLPKKYVVKQWQPFQRSAYSMGNSKSIAIEEYHPSS